MTVQRKLRCAIYTRKSTEEGLDQEFNSLDAQRDACAAFIASQVGLGWTSVTTRYDDGGVSGGTMDRPGLQRLLQDIRDRRVDVVVVYKIDRLTRSLADFAKIVEVFDASAASFVSVTQQFNTTTSMGRLTLNVLLSFAQFEREVTAERIRDKIAASKAKGMWMGGTIPLGYAVVDRKLIPHDAQADFVRHLFRRYLELRSAPELAAEVSLEAAVASQSAGQQDARFYRRSMRPGMLYKVLSNPLYIGKVRHRERVHDGEHQGLVDRQTFDAVQTLLESNAAVARGSRFHGGAHMLNGLLFDDTGDRMRPSGSGANGKRYRYYISQRIRGSKQNDVTAWRVPSPAIERIVIQFVASVLTDHPRLIDWIRQEDGTAGNTQQLLQAASALKDRTIIGTRIDQQTIVRAVLSRITLGSEAITFGINTRRLVELLAAGDVVTSLSNIDDAKSDALDGCIDVKLPIRMKQRGFETKIIVDGDLQPAAPEPSLIALIARAHLYLKRMTSNPPLSSTEIAAEFGVDRADVGRTLPLAFLAPRLVDQILTGRQSPLISARNLARAELPLLWSEQIAAFSD